MIRQIINVGMARSGTYSMAILFKRLGIESSHEKRLVRMKIERTHYDLDNWPSWLTKYLDIWNGKIPTNINWFDSDYEKSTIIYALEKTFPFLYFTIIIRNATDCCNSLRDWHRSFKSTQKEEMPDHFFKKYWEPWYDWLYIQIVKMKKKPFIMLFDKLINNGYKYELLRMFDIQESKIDIVNNHFFNPLDKYHIRKKIQRENIPLSNENEERAEFLINRLTDFCKNSWLEGNINDCELQG